MHLPQLHIRILARENRVIDRTWGTQDHCDPYWRLYVNKRRGAYVTLGAERYDIVPNRIHLIPAWVSLRCHSECVTEHLYIHFDVIGLSRPMLREVLPRPVALEGRVEHGAVVRSLFARKAADFHDEVRTTMSAQALVCESIGRLCAGLSPEKLRRLIWATVDLGRIAQVLQLIESHLDQRLGNDLLARTADLSKSAFIREFARVSGQTPARYATERRVAAAAERLAHSGESIDAIAERFGFADRFYFTRAFTRLMGVSPARYRTASQR
jgi:AraC-like DNA-binding protein